MVILDVNPKDEMSIEVEVEVQEHQERIHVIYTANDEQRTGECYCKRFQQLK